MQLVDIYEQYMNANEQSYGFQDNMDWMNTLYQALDVVLFAAVNKEKLSAEQRQTLLTYVQQHIEERLNVTMFEGRLNFIRFAEKNRLSEWECFCLIVASACHANPKYQTTFARLQQQENTSYATRGLMYDLYETVSGEKHGPVSAYFREQFEKKCFVDDHNMWEYANLFRKPLIIKMRLYQWFCGNEAMTQEMSHWCTLFRGRGHNLSFLGFEKEQQQLNTLLMNERTEELPVIFVKGKVGSGRKSLIQKVMAEQKKDLLFAEAEQLPQETFKDALDALILEADLRECGICLCGCRDTAAISYLLMQQLPREVLITAEERIYEKIAEQSFPLRPIFGIELSSLGVQQKITLWKNFLQDYKTEEVDAVELGNKYLLNAGEIKSVLQQAAILAGSLHRSVITREDVIVSVKKRNSRALGPFAELMESSFEWEDLIVEPEVKIQLQYICNRLIYRNVVGYEWGFAGKAAYGRGTCALFYGPPGTGKTMAAQVLANEMGLDLYRIDISRMVSKYIGETQKHISELFERAKYSNALLFFDEADAFFSKRTEVSDAHDRNANSEIAHLLQKLEQYEGISILATNLNENIDNAFKRRIQYMVNFQFPDTETRRLFWHKMLPKQAPAEQDLDLDYFAEHFELSGSEIKECMFHAAYKAAAEHSNIGNRHIADAVKLCMGKYGKILSKDDFGYLL